MSAGVPDCLRASSQRSSQRREGAHAWWAACLLAAACGLPRDPERTSERVQGGTLVAASVIANAAEESLLARGAGAMGAQLELRRGELHGLVDALRHGEVQVVYGRIPKDTPFAELAARTVPVDANGHVFLLRPGENGFLMAWNRILHRDY